MGELKPNREWIKANLWARWANLETGQKRGLPPPELQKPAPDGAPLIDLDDPASFTLGQAPLLDLLRRRSSLRQYSPEPLSLAELSFLLWATQGVHRVVGGGLSTKRTVPSGGARHPFETYLAVLRVSGLEPGLYRYLALDHRLCFLGPVEDLSTRLAQSCADFAAHSAVTFAWTAIPYRTEWRYGPLSPKLIAQDSGHLCQNLYLACEAIGAGTCAVGAFNQQAMDALLGVDGEEEFTLYCGPVGKRP